MSEWPATGRPSVSSSWDDRPQFCYDRLKKPSNKSARRMVRSTEVDVSVRWPSLADQRSIRVPHVVPNTNRRWWSPLGLTLTDAGRDRLAAGALFLGLLVVYNANGREIGSSDSQPTKFAARE